MSDTYETRIHYPTAKTCDPTARIPCLTPKTSGPAGQTCSPTGRIRSPTGKTCSQTSRINSPIGRIRGPTARINSPTATADLEKGTIRYQYQRIIVSPSFCRPANVKATNPTHKTASLLTNPPCPLCLSLYFLSLVPCPLCLSLYFLFLVPSPLPAPPHTGSLAPCFLLLSPRQMLKFSSSSNHHFSVTLESQRLNICL